MRHCSKGILGSGIVHYNFFTTAYLGFQPISPSFLKSYVYVLRTNMNNMSGLHHCFMK